MTGEGIVSAIDLGAAMRAARLSSGRSVQEIAARFRGDGDRGSSANSYLYDAEKGRRPASQALVEAYAEICAAPELLSLRSRMDEFSRTSVERFSATSNTTNPNSVLRRLRDRFDDQDLDDSHNSTSKLDDVWIGLAREYAANNSDAQMAEPVVCHGRRESSLMVAQLLSWAAKNDKITGTVVIVSSDGDALYVPESDDMVATDASAGLLHGTFLFRCIVECLLSRGIDVIHIRPEAVNASGRI
jgi:transcriptional regulator with XRE-family HTH domain